MNKKALFLVLISVLFALSALVRFYQLGYSHFYGDETKTLYLDKTVPAFEFFMQQRKGPVQFAVVWVVEKITGAYLEGHVRTPFALAGFLSVVVFYLLCARYFSKWVSLVSTWFFSFGGFFVAFSKTAQYQSFLLLFGLLSLLLIVLWSQKKFTWLLFLSSFSLGLAFLCHYDAVFYLVPVSIVLFAHRSLLSKKQLFMFISTLTLLVGLFYLPYFAKGYFSDNSAGYLSRRFVGSSDSLPNNTLVTLWVYNPCGVYFVVMFIGLLGILLLLKKKVYYLVFWFLIPFIFFTLIKSPGTHILNFIIPLHVSFGFVLEHVVLYLNRLNRKPFIRIGFAALSGFCTLLLLIQLFVTSTVFTPMLSKGYPWRDVNYGLFKRSLAPTKYQLFLYGFPYYRNWDNVALVLKDTSGFRGYYTNDNSVMAHYYLLGYSFTPFGTNFMPQYVIEVQDNMDFEKPVDTEVLSMFYERVRSFENEYGQKTVLYKKVSSPLAVR